jgi:O-antigen ligase
VLDFWTRLGLLGLLVAVLMLIGFWREAWALYRRLPEGDMRALTIGLMAAMVASLAHGLIDNSFFLVDLAFVLMLMLAAIQTLSQQRDPVAEPQNH